MFAKYNTAFQYQYMINFRDRENSLDLDMLSSFSLQLFLNLINIKDLESGKYSKASIFVCT